MTPYVVLFRKFWWAIPMAGLSIALAIQVMRANSWETSSVRWEGRYTTEVANHRITRASVTTLQAAIDADNAEDIAAGEAYQDARTEAARADARADAQFGATNAAIGALRASVGRNAPNECNVPVEVRNALR